MGMPKAWSLLSFAQVLVQSRNSWLLGSTGCSYAETLDCAYLGITLGVLGTLGDSHSLC